MMATNAATKAARALRMLQLQKGADTIMEKVNIVNLADGKCKAELKVAEEHSNQRGCLHGGVTAMLVDSLSSWALCTHEKGTFKHVSLDIHISSLAEVQIGSDIVIDASVVRAGKTLAFLEVDITDKASGDLLVKGTNNKLIMPDD